MTSYPAAAINAAQCAQDHDLLFITLDTLRHDVACAALAAGETPHLQTILPGGEWEKRHTPGSFTYAAHHAFFAGFLPTPARPGPHARLFAARFAGSETTGAGTLVLDAPDIVTGLAAMGWRTVCIGGVGFFNKQTPLGAVLPGLFQVSHWREEFGVTCKQSTENQVSLAISEIEETPLSQRIFLFLNISACHQPNYFHLEGAQSDSPQSQQAALAYVDSQLPPLFAAMQARGPVLTIICSDHGAAYGEDGYEGHRLAHPAVWEVPYMETILPQSGAAQ